MNINKIIREEIQKLNESAGKNVPITFFDAVVQKLGGTPTDEKRKFFKAWQRAEGTDAKFNPLATTLKLKKDHGGSSDFKFSKNKGRPVQDYKTFEAGVDATYWTLKNTNGGRAYQNLVSKLKADDTTAQELAAETEELSTWNDASGKYVANVLGTANKTNTSNSKPEPQPEDDIDITTSLSAEPESDEISQDVNAISDTNASDTEFIDKLQRILDFAGFIPVVGDALDAVNGIIYLVRGKLLDAALSLIALAPAIGSALAVPLRIAFKSAKKLISPNMLKLAFKAKPGAWRDILLTLTDKKLLGMAALDPKTLKTLADQGDSIAQVLIDANKSLLKSFPNNKTINSLAAKSNEAAEAIRLLRKEADDLVKNGIKSSDQLAASLKTVDPAMFDKYIKTLTFGFKPNKVANFIFSPRLVTAVKAGDSYVLDGLSKRFAKDFDKVMINKDVYPVLFNNSMRTGGFGQEVLNKQTLDALNNILRQNGFKGTVSSASNLAKQYKTNPVFKQMLTKSMPDILADTSNFSKFIGDVNLYKRSFLEKQLADVKNVFSKNVGLDMLKKGLLPTNLGKFANVNGFKIFAKLNYIGREMVETKNDLLTTWGNAVIRLSLFGYQSAGILSLGSALTDEDKQQLEINANEIEQAQKQLKIVMQDLPNEDFSTWSKEELELLDIMANYNQ